MQISEQVSKWQQLLARANGYEEDPAVRQLFESLSQTFRAVQRIHDRCEKDLATLAAAMDNMDTEFAQFLTIKDDAAP